ncbi:hypothetical protein WOLCODRAFT_150665 [Wolfiporia cocos MD-104 SS10]|uniref:Uncharacterized protein n=1 Tax=Wolfiporia cocos (strain MD-104) TaxID=742152 RepID=A0A2H3JV60_WOLCO|nr:hypothetical protein WOLCODRAFT_150665 [Wolfiporia cocos MD-104 SS10]
MNGTRLSVVLGSGPGFRYLRSLRATVSSLREQPGDLEEEYTAQTRGTSQTISAQKQQIAGPLEGQRTQCKHIADERGAELADLRAKLDDARSEDGD